MQAALVSLIVLAGLSGLETSSSTEPGFQAPDCGVHSLYLILQLTGHPADLSQIDRALPARRDDGYSMAELQAAARANGLRLQGVKLGPHDFPLDRPVIAYTHRHRPGGGHFIVIQPVGVTGTLVQILEPPYPPQVIPYDNLIALHPLPLPVLIPRSPIDMARSLGTIAGGTILLGALAAWLYRRSRRCPLLTKESLADSPRTSLHE
jgi:hypothetical protein